MTAHLNRVKGRRDLPESSILGNGMHGNRYKNLAGRSGFPPLPLPPRPSPFFTARAAPPPPSPFFAPRPPGRRAAMVSPSNVAADLNLRGGSGPPSPMPQSKPSKTSHRLTLAWLAGGKSSKSKRKSSKKTGGYGLERELRAENPNELLIRGYGSGEENGQAPFQPRRTLDQYFYSHLDNTAHRDRDQVVYRWTQSDRPKIFMVDQMWLWIINGGLCHTD